MGPVAAIAKIRTRRPERTLRFSSPEPATRRSEAATCPVPTTPAPDAGRSVSAMLCHLLPGSRPKARPIHAACPMLPTQFGGLAALVHHLLRSGGHRSTQEQV